MKRVVFLLSFLFVTCITAFAQPAPTADELLSKAYKQADKEKKNVIVIFHASWCGWCHRMDKAINDPACKKFFDDEYVIVHLVVDEAKDKKQLENPGAAAFRTKYHGDDQGIPFWLVFDKEGKLLADSKIREAGEGPEKGQNTGCPANEKEVNYFVDILKRTSDLDSQQLEIIRKRFRENEK